MKRLIWGLLLFLINTLVISGQVSSVTSTYEHSNKEKIEGKYWFSFDKGQFVTSYKYEKNGNKDFVVVPAKGYTQKELFQKILLGLNDMYTDIDKIVKKIEYDAITINNYYKCKKEEILKTDDGVYKVLGWHERYSFKFKDEKLRIDAPIVVKLDLEDFSGKKNSLSLTTKRTEMFFSGSSIIQETLIQMVNNAFNESKDNW